MADNVPVTPGTGKTIATDEVTDGTLGTVQVQYIKIMDGTLDGTNKAAVTANGLKVEATGNVAAGATDSGNPIKVGGKYNSTPPTLSDGQRGDVTLTSSSAVRTSLADYIEGEDGTNHWLVTAGKTATADFTATSPSSATTTAQTAITGLGGYRTATFMATLTGATGGTLDVYLQMSPDGGTTWVDYVHFAQLSAGASAVTKIFTVSKHGQQTTITTAGTGTTPALAANTVIGGDWGDRLRVVFVAGSGTTAGASQTIKAIFTT